MNQRESKFVNADQLKAMIAENAYLRAEKRGFIEGFELEDWFESEKKVNNQCRYWLIEDY